MATDYAYPYRVAPESVKVEIVSTTPEVAVDHHHVDLRSLTEENGVEFTLELRCTVDPERITSVLAPGTDLSTTMLAVRQRSVGSHLRSIEVAAAGELEATMVLCFKIEDHYGSLELEPLLLLAEDVDAPHGFARAAGSVLSWGPTLRLQFDSAEPFATGSMLEVEWRNFEEDPDLPDRSLHVLRTEGQPKLLLNSASAAAYDVLRSEATSGTKARLRDFTFASIATSTWSSLLRSSYTALRVQVGSNPDQEAWEHMAELPDWQRSVLETWAPLLFNLDREDAVVELCRAAAADDTDPLTQLDSLLHQQLEPRPRFEKLAESALGD